MRQALPPALTNYLLIALAISQSILYASLMPLWEGFDEPYHYGYVQFLATTPTTPALPILGQTPISQELRNSIVTTPVSHVVQHDLPELQTFDQARSGQKPPIPGKFIPTDHTNYEIQQAPLAYALLAPFGFVLQNAAMPVRILWLRIVNALLSVAATLAAAQYFFRGIALSAPYRQLASFCILTCQMFQATTAHISNDGIALALTLWFFGAIANRATPIRLALITALGLLTKAYFLPLAAFSACLLAWRTPRRLPAFAAIILAIAGPWYARNLFLYHNLSGLPMAAVPPREALTALLKVDWLRTIPYMLRATLWTGNNSFTTFNAFTLNCFLLLIAIGFVLYLASKAVDRALFAAIAVYAAAVIYVVGNDVILLHGQSAGAAPWYTFPLFAPIVGLSLRSAPRPLAIGFVLLSAWICIATYIVKLIPLYGGYPEGRSTLAGLWRWYTTQGPQLIFSLAPPTLIYLETGLVTTLIVTLAIRLC